MPFLDFDTLVISDNAYIDDTSAPACDIGSFMSFFHDLGIRNFCVLHAADPSATSLSHISGTCKQFTQQLIHSKPRGSSVHVACDVHLSPSVLTNPAINKLCFPHSQALFLQTPPFADGSWLDSDLKHLVYKQNIRPIFSSFERMLITCEPSFCSALMRIRGAAFCIDINYMVNPSFESVMRKAISDNIAIIPCVSNQLYAYSGIVERFSDLSNLLGRPTYLQLCRHISASCKTVLSQR